MQSEPVNVIPTKWICREAAEPVPTFPPPIVMLEKAIYCDVPVSTDASVTCEGLTPLAAVTVVMLVFTIDELYAG
jgi:hypothetical protein